MPRLSLLICLLFYPLQPFFAQNNPVLSCSTDDFLQKKLQNDPVFSAHHADLEQQYRQWIKASSASSQLQKATFSNYTIPVVVHIIHQNGSENISDAQVLQGIQQLNHAFANSGYYDQNNGFATPFQFCLARRKPDGSATTGINHVSSPLTDMVKETDDLALKNLIQWNSLNYVNIWLVAAINSQSSGSGVAGYAYLPSAHGTPFDGIVMEAEWFGSSAGNTGVLIHEMGHYLGLLHTFEGGCYNQDCTQDGDRVCDTPPDQSTAWSACGTIQNSCTTDVDSGFATDQNDMTINYMDYATLDCYNGFTEGQSARMEFFLLEVRESLLQSDGCNDPCTIPVTAAFTASAAGALTVGTTVGFTNNSTNGNTYDWSLNGVLMSNMPQWSHTFSNEGVQIVTLKVTGIDPNCTAFFSDTFLVTCPLQPGFFVDNPYPEPGALVTFTSTGTGATQYQWSINGLDFGNTPVASTTLPQPGVYSICLTTSTGWCTRTYCKTLEIEDTTGCNDNLFRLLFTPATMNNLALLPNGSYLTGGGYWADSSYLMQLTPDAQPINGRSFNIFPNENEYIVELKSVSGDFVIGIGISDIYAPESQWKSFVFKYDYQAQNFAWIRTFDQASFQFDIIRTELRELPASGNYFINSQNRKSYGRSFHLVLDPSTGNVLSSTEYGETNTTIAFKKLERVGQQLYTAGYRIGLTPYPSTLLNAWDANGQPLWSKEYVGAQTSLYSFSMCDWNDHLYLLSDGADTNQYIVVIKTDLLGQRIWSKRIELPFNSILTNGKTILPSGNGLIIHLVNPSEGVAYFYKLDEDGNLLWHRRLQMPTNFILNQIQAAGNDLWLLGGQSIAFGRSVLLRINPEKAFDGVCKLYQAADAQIYDFPLTVIDRSLESLPVNFMMKTPNVPIRSAPFIMFDWCPVVTCPEICGNGLDDDADGYVDGYDTENCPAEPVPDCADRLLRPDSLIAARLDWTSAVVPVNNGWTPPVANLNPLQDNTPEIVHSKQSSAALGDTLLIFHGDGSNADAPFALEIPEQFSNTPATTPAIGDINGDGIPELVLLCADQRLRVYTLFDPATQPVMSLLAVSMETSALPTHSKPLLADLNQDGFSEIYIGTEVYQFDFSNPGAPALNRVVAGTSGPFSIAADLLSVADCGGDPDCEGLEIAVGHSIYSIDLNTLDGDPVEIKMMRDLNDLSPQKQFEDGKTSVADIDLDGLLDIVVAGKSESNFGVYAWNKNGIIQFFPIGAAGLNESSLVSIGQVYDDRLSGATLDLPELMVSAEDRMYALNLNAAIQTPAAPYWWLLPLAGNNCIHPVTLFDFNKDGWSEIVTRDQDSLRIIYGGLAPFPSGVHANRNWAALSARSNTLDEYPVIADVDNDNQAEIVIGGGIPAGALIVLESDPIQSTPWLPTSPLWNQYSYYAVSVEEDLQIPRNQQKSQLEFPTGSGKHPLNMFLGQPPKYDGHFNPYLPLPDARISVSIQDCDQDTLSIRVQVCNQGSARLPAGTPIRGYLGSPVTINASLLPSAPLLSQDIEPDSCLFFDLKWVLPSNGQTVYIMVNDNGSQATPFNLATDFPLNTIAECQYWNNIDSFSLHKATPALDLGPDLTVCQNGVWRLHAGAAFQSYQWSDLSTDSSTTVYQPGTYWVAATDFCGCVYRDTIKISVDPATLIELGADTILCENGSLQFNLNGFANYQWFPATGLSCANCANPLAQPLGNITYSVIAKTALGCLSTDSIQIQINPAFQTSEIRDICNGDSALIFGQWQHQAGVFSQTFSAISGCDSTHSVMLQLLPAFQTSEIRDICSGDSALIFGQWQSQAGVFSQTFSAIGGCDSTHSVTLQLLPAFQTSEIRDICIGDSALIFGQWQSQTGVFSQTFSAIGGCDSTHSVTLQLLPTFQTSEIRDICNGDSALIFGQWQHQAGIFSQTFSASGGCDSTHSVTLQLLPAFQTSEIRDICNGDSALIFGQWQHQAGVFSQTFSAIGGCDSTHSVTLQLLPAFQTSEIRDICSGDSVLIFGQWQHQAGVFSQTFSAIGGCDSTHSIVLNLNPLPEVELEWTSPACANQANGSILVLNGTADLEFSLNGADFQPEGGFDALPAGDYQLRARNIFGCILEKNILLSMPPVLNLELPGDTLITAGEAVALSPQSNGNLLNYTWSPTQFLSCNDCPLPIATPIQSITYFLRIEDDQGCQAMDSIRIQVTEQTAQFYIPNTFQPGSGNGNHLLGVFAPHGVREVARMEVFDRWGNLVFRQEHFPADGTSGWDGSFRGKTLMPGVYVYLLEILFEDGTKKILNGDVTLLR